MEQSAPFIQGGGNMFEINGIKWDIVWVNPNSDNLRRSDGSITVAVTDWNDKCVYMSNMLRGEFMRKVLAHELVHCFMFSFSIHIPIQEEEFIADWVANYGTDLIYLLDDLMQTLKKAYIA